MRRMFQNAQTRAQCHIYQMLRLWSKKPHLSFHTPGHKNAKWDITELAYSDNLSSPRGVIKRAQEDIEALVGAEKSFILTDGSTSGVWSMLYAAKLLGAKRVLAREDSHKSLYNACAVLGLELLLLPAIEQNGIPAALTVEEIPEKLLSNADVLFVTSPNYYGGVAPLSALRELCDKEKKLLIIDGAHGGHLRFNQALYAGTVADFWVDGVHKSLPALTQGATVHARTKEGGEALQKAVDCFRTTSPSYPIMASVEYAVKYPQNQGLERAVKEYAAQTQRVRLGEDWTKLCAVFSSPAFTVEKQLNEQGIFPEFCDGNVICFYLSPTTSIRTFKRLTKQLNALFKQYPYVEQKQTQRIPAPVILQEKASEWVEIEDSENRVLAANIGLFPPCVPLKKAGERMDKESIQTMRSAANVFGVADGKIAVYKE